MTPTATTNITRQFDDGEMQPHDPNATIAWADLVDQLSAPFSDRSTRWDASRT